MSNRRAEIACELMRHMPGWTPPTEATLVNNLALGIAKVPFFTTVGKGGYVAVVVGGEASLLDDEAIEALTFLLERTRIRRERKQAAAHAETAAADERGDAARLDGEASAPEPERSDGERVGEAAQVSEGEEDQR